MIVSIFIILIPWEPTDGLEGKLTTVLQFNGGFAVAVEGNV